MTSWTMVIQQFSHSWPSPIIKASESQSGGQTYCEGHTPWPINPQSDKMSALVKKVGVPLQYLTEAMLGEA